MKDVCLVLSSGAARGLAHIGAIEELERRGYRIRSVTGCSMGALVGGMYAAGRLREFVEWMRTVNRRKIFSLLDLTLSTSHLVKGNRVIESLQEIVPDVPIETLPVLYRAVATDWEKGCEVVFSGGSLYRATRLHLHPRILQPRAARGVGAGGRRRAQSAAAEGNAPPSPSPDSSAPCRAGSRCWWTAPCSIRCR